MVNIIKAEHQKASNVFVLCAEFGWSDLGSWSALYDHSPKNKDENVTQNKTGTSRLRFAMVIAPAPVFSGRQTYGRAAPA